MCLWEGFATLQFFGISERYFCGISISLHICDIITFLGILIKAFVMERNACTEE